MVRSKGADRDRSLASTVLDRWPKVWGIYGANWGVDPAWGRSGQIVGIVFGLMAGVATLLIARSSLWSVEQLWDWQMIRSAQVLISGFIFGLAVGLWFGMDHGAIFGLLCGGFSGLGLGLMAGLGSGQRNHPLFGPRVPPASS